MKQISATELDNFKRLYFRDFFNNLLLQDLKKYFHPYWNMDYCIEPKNKIGYWLWEQYTAIIHIADGDIVYVFTNKLFDKFLDDEKFISFLYSY